MGFNGLLAVGVISEFGEAVYCRLSDFVIGGRCFLWLDVCVWLRHGPKCLCVFVVCVYHVDDVFGCLVYLRRGKVLIRGKVLEEVIGGRVSLLSVGIS